MSSTRTSRSKSQLLKLDSSSGKPCIDFQPDARWGIKEGNEEEEDGNAKVRRSSRKRKSNSQVTASEKKHAVNGECSIILLDDEEDNETNHKNAPKSPVKKPAVGASNSDIASRSIHKKRKTSPCPSPKVSQNSPNCKNGMDADCNDAEIHDSKEKEISTPESDPKKDNKERDSSIKEKLSTKKMDSSMKEDKLSTKEMDSSMKELQEEKDKLLKMKEKPSFQDLRKKSDLATNEEKTIPEKEASNENLCSSFKKEDCDIAIIEEKMPSDGGDSDNEIQILNSRSRLTPEDMEKTKEKLCEQSLSKENKLSKEELLLSSGFPYFNSLKENIPTLIPGAYKPVKFPHSGTLILEDNEVIIESPSLLVPLLIKEVDKFPTLDENDTQKQKTRPHNFFESSVGQFLINLGSSRVFEWFHKDMKRFKHRQLNKDPDSREHKAALAMHTEKLLATKLANSAFTFRMKKCEFCEFKTESRLVMDGHYRIPHLTSRREYRCNFCNFMCRDFKEMDFHFEALHGKKILSDDQVLFECRYCSFHSSIKSKVNAHLNRCRKYFLPTQNLCPPIDFECPGITTKPVSIQDIINHRRMLMGTKQPYLTSGQSIESLTSAFARKKLASVLSLTGADSIPDSPTLIKHLMGPQAKQLAAAGMQLPPGLILSKPRSRVPNSIPPGRPQLQPRIQGMRSNGPRSGNLFPSTISNPAAHLASSGISITPVRSDGSNRVTSAVTGAKGVTLTPISSAGNQVVSQKPGPPQPVALFTNVAGNELSKVRAGMVAPQSSRMPMIQPGRPTRMMPPYQRLNTPPSQVVKNSAGNTFVLCEICDAYIKDLEELRSHMNWVHKVKIHPKMLVSRPPLNCQKCQWRFFTDQGLERHLLGAHGLVTTNMQEMANKNQDGGRCIICGAVFTYKLVSHMTQVHKVTLKPAHLSYKCTVCTATFTLYRLFESHVYNVHSAAAKRPSEESSPSEPPEKIAKKAIPAVSTTTTTTTDDNKSEQLVIPKCHECGKTIEDMQKHIIENHMKKCSVKLCRIETCTKFQYSSDEMLLIDLSGLKSESDADSDSSEESSDEEENDDSKSSKNGDLKESNST